MFDARNFHGFIESPMMVGKFGNEKFDKTKSLNFAVPISS